MRRRRSLGGAFSPRKLFASGVNGAWYDPSDYSTLFQDSAGTTPVTAVEQSVGLMLDKSQGLVLGSELVPATIPSVSGAGWTTNGTSITATSSTASGTITLAASTPTTKSYQVTFTASALSGATSYMVFSSGVAALTKRISTAKNYSFILPGQGTAVLEFAPYEGTAYSVTISNISIKEIAGNHALQATSGSRPVLRARYNNFVATATLATQNVTTLAASYKLSFTGTGTVTLTGTNVGVYSAGTNTITCTAGTLTATVVGTVTNADLRLSSTATSMPAYQLVTTSTNYDTVDFLPYLALDGSNDSFGTASINFTTTDKMSVCAGITKLSDAAQAVVAELSATIASNNGSFLLTAPNSAAANFNFSSKGTTQVDNTVVTYASPYTAVLAASGDISGGTNSIKVNGGTATTSSSSQGTGNYGNYSLYIGRRNNASLPFNGRIYQMVFCGKALSTSELTAVETFVNRKTGAY
jgi:hypothetical protein